MQQILFSLCLSEVLELLSSTSELIFFVQYMFMSRKSKIYSSFKILPGLDAMFFWKQLHKITQKLSLWSADALLYFAFPSLLLHLFHPTIKSSIMTSTKASHFSKFAPCFSLHCCCLWRCPFNILIILCISRSSSGVSSS